MGAGHHSRFGDDNALLRSSNLAVLSLGRPGEEGGNAAVDILWGMRQPGTVSRTQEEKQEASFGYRPNQISARPNQMQNLLIFV